MLNAAVFPSFHQDSEAELACTPIVSRKQSKSDRAYSLPIHTGGGTVFVSVKESLFLIHDSWTRNARQRYPRQRNKPSWSINIWSADFEIFPQEALLHQLQTPRPKHLAPPTSSIIPKGKNADDTHHAPRRARQAVKPPPDAHRRQKSK